MNRTQLPSRRSFLRVAVAAAPALGAAMEAPKALAQAVPTNAGSAIVARVHLDQQVYDATAIAQAEILFRAPATGAVSARWIDSFGRVIREFQFQPSASGVAPMRISLNVAETLTYQNYIRVWVNGVEQMVGGEFLRSPQPAPWDDFHVIEYATYPEGLYGKLREAGVDAEIGPREGDFSYILENNFNFNVEQMAWQVFAIYHKNQPLWRGLLAQILYDRNNMKLWVRNPCLNDPKTDEYLREHLTRYVTRHRAFRPLFYNIADELGQGDQIRPNDFCHSDYCTAKFAEYLHKMYGPAFGEVYRLRPTGELNQWDDSAVKNGKGWLDASLAIDYTTTDRAFDAVAVANLQNKYGNVARLNEAWGTNFPVASGNEDREAWTPVLAAIRETRSVPDPSAQALEARLGPIGPANALWGSQTGWGAREAPTTFKSWGEVAQVIKRFYDEVAQVHTTDGWDVTRWCDFRNFQDQSFADAIGRARALCKSLDPYARCSTEGGQAPFAYGWYNYENVTKVVDVIEPYNIGNNVEVIRSLNPEVIMLSTHGFEYTKGKALTERDRMFQKHAIRPIWWGLFHGHRGSFIWDEVLPDYAFVDPETGQFTPAAETFSATFNELHDGISKLFINARRLHDGIAIHYSQPSIQIHWLLDNVQNARQWMIHSGEDRFSRFTGLRNSWTKLIEDLGLQYNFVGGRQIEAGALASGDYKAFIMPQSIALSAHEANQIRQFVQNGGLLIADYRIGSMNEHGRDLRRGQLDDVFGIARASGRSKGNGASGQADFETLKLAGKQLQVKAGDERVGLNGGKALAQSGSVPLVIVNQFGQGTAVFLNLDMTGYAFDRLQPNPGTSLPELLESVFALAKIEPKVRVLDASGKPLRGTEVVRFANGAYEHIAVFRNPQFDDGGWGNYPTQKLTRGWAGEIDNSVLEQPEDVTIAWPGTMSTYSIRGRKQLGETDKVQAHLDPWTPLAFTRAPQAVPALQVSTRRQGPNSRMIEIMLGGETELPGDTFRVVRLELLTPDGKPYNLYARNLILKSGPHTERIPIALNDPAGTWRVRARDVATGETQEKTFSVS